MRSMIALIGKYNEYCSCRYCTAVDHKPNENGQCKAFVNAASSRRIRLLPNVQQERTPCKLCCQADGTLSCRNGRDENASYNKQGHPQSTQRW